MIVNSPTQVITAPEREKIYQKNFALFLLDGIFFSVAMSILGTTTVIPDFVRHLTDSKISIGLSGSLFDISWTLPQLFVARYIIRVARKKWWFVGPNIPVRIVILIFAGLVVLLGVERPAVILVAFFICYGIAGVGDGIVGVPWADLTGTSLDHRWRARMFGFMSAIAGLIMLGVSPLIGVILGEKGPGFPNNYALLFGIAGILFVLSIFPVIFVRELPGGKGTEKVPSFSEFIPLLGDILRRDKPFRAVLITRLLISLMAMAGPFYIVYATTQLGLTSNVAVPTLLLMQTMGSLFGALLYSWLGARNNLLYIRLALVCAACLPITALVAAVVSPYMLLIGFFLSGLSLTNLFIALQNWVVTHANPEQRPIYAGLFNTIAATISLTSPFIAGTIVQQISYEALFIFSLLMALSALFVVVRYVRHVQPNEQSLILAVD